MSEPTATPPRAARTRSTRATRPRTRVQAADPVVTEATPPPPEGAIDEEQAAWQPPPAAPTPPAAPESTARAHAPVANVSVKLPLMSASVSLPGPGATARLGPMHVQLPTGTLYYAGLGALAVGGALEWPVAAGLAAGGFAVGRVRRMLGR